LITTDDLEHAVRINAHLETAGFQTTLASSFDDVRRAVGTGAATPDCIVLTGALHESSAAQLLRIAHDRSISTLGLVEHTDPDPKALARELGLTAFLEKPADPAEVTATVRRLIERRRLQARRRIAPPAISPAITYAFSAVRRRCSRSEWKWALGKRQPNAGKRMAIQMEESAVEVATSSPPMSSARCVATPANTAQSAGRRVANASASKARANTPLCATLRDPLISVSGWPRVQSSP